MFYLVRNRLFSFFLFFQSIFLISKFQGHFRAFSCRKFRTKISSPIIIEECGIIPLCDEIKRIAIVDGCNVLHKCKGLGLYSELRITRNDSLVFLLIWLIFYAHVHSQQETRCFRSYASG